MFDNNDWAKLKKAIVFVLTPTIEVIATQPIWAVMKQLQGEFTQKPTLNLNPSYLYRGFGSNLAGFSATIIMQMYLTDSLEKKISANSEATAKEKAVAAFIAGVSSSIIACPTDALMTWQQNPAEHAKPRLFQSLPATMMQESACSVFFLVVGPMIKNMLKPYVKDQNTLSFMSGTVAGIGASLISQPANTMRSFQQKSLEAKGTYETAVSIYSKYGARGFFQGMGPRLGMVTTSIAIMTFVKDYLENALEVHESKVVCNI